MKLQDPTLNLEIKGDIRTAGFGMKHTRKSFHMVTSGIYSNKIRAIVRELSTNAWDSHFSAGKANEPFVVHLPNSLEPYFSVKDNGIGMSEDFVFERYTTYFDSDKTDSDDLTGCWGLGSKTPFCYGDSFSVRSRYEGEAKSYVAFFDKDGLPSIAKMGEEHTDEPNGVEVSFPVKPEDFGKFQLEAEDVLSWFKPRPIVKGCADFEFKEVEYIKKNEFYAIVNSCRGHSNLVMGNVSYPIGRYDVSLDSIAAKIVEHGVDLFVPMGQGVEVTIGREKLSYTKGTIAVVQKYVAEVVESVKKEIEDEIGKAPTLWQARRMLHDYRHSILGQVKTLVSVKWNGKDITDHVDIDNAKLNATLQVLSKRRKKFMRHQETTLFADGRYIFHNDMEWGGYARITNYLEDKNQHRACVLTNFNKDFLDATGVGEVLIKASSLPKPQRTQSARTYIKKHTAKLLKFDASHDRNHASNYWSANDVEMSAGGIYVVISHYSPLDKDGNKYTPSYLKHIVNSLRTLSDEEDEVVVYGVRKIDVPKLNKYGNWVKLEDYVCQVVKENEDFCDEYIKRVQFEELENSYDVYLKHTFEDTSLFGRFLQEYKEAKNSKKSDRLDAFIFLNNRFQVNALVDSEKNKLTEMEKEVLEKYPLVQYKDKWYNNDLGAMVEYIRAKDANPDLEFQSLPVEKINVLSYLDWNEYRHDDDFIAFVAEYLSGKKGNEGTTYSLLKHLDFSEVKDSKFANNLAEYVHLMTIAEEVLASA